LGNEADAVIISNKDISEPSFFGFANVTDFVWVIDGQRFMPLPFAGVSAPDEVLDLKVRFNSALPGILATIPRLSAKQHAQLAVLTDIGNPTIYIDYHTPSTWQTYPTIPAQFPANEFYSPANSIGYDASVKVSLRRGVYRQNYVSFGWPRDDIIFCKPGYERCTQSTLPPLSPGDRVNWTMNF
jgi:hypothetical protein